MSNLNITVIKTAKVSFPRVSPGTFVLVQPRNSYIEPYWEPIHLLNTDTEVVIERRECVGSQRTKHSDWQVHDTLQDALDATREERLGGGFSFEAQEELERRLETIGSDRYELEQDASRFSL